MPEVGIGKKGVVEEVADDMEHDVVQKWDKVEDQRGHELRMVDLLAKCSSLMCCSLQA